MKKTRITIIIAIMLLLTLIIPIFSACSTTDNVKSKMKSMAKNGNYTITIDGDMQLGNEKSYRYVYASSGKLAYADSGNNEYYYDKRYSAEILDYYKCDRGMWYFNEMAVANDKSERPYAKSLTYKALQLAIENLAEHYEVTEIAESAEVDKKVKVWSLKQASYSKIFTRANGVCYITVTDGIVTISTNSGTNIELAKVTKVGSTVIRVPDIDIDQTQK